MPTIREIFLRSEENFLRGQRGMSTVGEETKRASQRLRKKYPGDNWLSTLEEIEEEDRCLDYLAKQFSLSRPTFREN